VTADRLSDGVDDVDDHVDIDIDVDVDVDVDADAVALPVAAVVVDTGLPHLDRVFEYGVPVDPVVS